MNSNESVTLWCQACKKETNCLDKGKRKNNKGAEPIADIHWLSRARICTVCDYEFFTAEVDTKFLTELQKTRLIIRSYKNIARDYKEGWFELN